tara:strand:- start:9911 stop:10426 length:516 start_codon:yes stop_codon:yes gene_type:complete
MIKNLRIKKGLTQEQLAEETSISVRTIQRIENGEVEPRAHSIHKIAEALEINYEDIVSQDNSTLELANGLAWKIAIHACAIFIIPLPSLGIWLWKKSTVPDIKLHAIASINFQLNMLAVLFLANLLSILILPVLTAIVAVLLYYALVFYNIVRVALELPFWYPPVHSFLKE